MLYIYDRLAKEHAYVSPDVIQLVPPMDTRKTKENYKCVLTHTHHQHNQRNMSEGNMFYKPHPGAIAVFIKIPFLWVFVVNIKHVYRVMRVIYIKIVS